MLKVLKPHALAAGLVALVSAGGSAPAAAQSYPIDCAILLCLAGGWPASEPCAQARAEFIRRITPWPVEPPLQIWRCPMGASYDLEVDGPPGPWFFDIHVRDDLDPLRQSVPSVPVSLFPASSVFQDMERTFDLLGDAPVLWQAQHRADTDISDPKFDFVRSIRVYHVHFATQRDWGDDACTRFVGVEVGRYGTQGEFAWRRSALDALPEAHIGLERWGEDCPSIRHRSVFVDWRDYEGNYGFEQVNY